MTSCSDQNQDLLVLPTEAASRVESCCLAGYPDEACGVLAGTTSRPGTYLVERVFPCRNVIERRRRDRYVLSPEDFLQADIEARTSGLEIVGIFHSHPDHEPVPSTTDLASAWQGYVYLIISTSARAAGNFRAWRLIDGRFAELDISNQIEDQQS